MKKLTCLAAFSALIGLSIGCDRGSIGGPKANQAPDNKAPMVTGNSEGTFSLDVPSLSTRIQQGEAKNVTITARRGKNFNQDVKVSFTDVPKGISIEPSSGTINASDTEMKAMVKAADDAPVGDHTINVSGQPTTGATATNHFTITVTKK